MMAEIIDTPLVIIDKHVDHKIDEVFTNPTSPINILVEKRS